MKKSTISVILLFVFGFVEIAIAQANFSTSLHATRNSKPYWYNKENGGFETLTNVPMSELGCVECHDAVDANGTAYSTTYTPSCVDCHATDMTVTQDDCLGCHSREKAIITAGISDVHRTAGFTCMSCHKSNDMHGDGTSYNSMFDPGAISTDCSNSGCHEGFTHTNPSVDPHSGKLHCTSCHASTNLACYNCHFESQVETHLKRAQRQITGFMILVNRTKDNKVHPATFQSSSYQGNTWIAMGPSVAHTITKTGARTCTDCHQNYGGSIPAITEYNSSGKIQFATWNSADSTLSWKQGIVPLPVDYLNSFKLDYITYNGNTSDPVAPSKNWSYVKDVSDGFQLLYATSLTTAQMDKLGMDTTWTIVPVELSSFTAAVNGLTVSLNWTTATEKNNSGFEVQKKVNEKFVAAGFVSGNGTTTEMHSYSFADKLLKGGKSIYRLKQMDYDGTFEYSKEVEVNVIYGMNYSLSQNYPNPFNPTTKISYTIPQTGFVEINVYDAIGNLIKTLVSGSKDAGSYDVEFDGSGLTSGIYFYQIKSGNFTDTKKFVLMK